MVNETKGYPRATSKLCRGQIILTAAGKSLVTESARHARVQCLSIDWRVQFQVSGELSITSELSRISILQIVNLSHKSVL